MSDLLLDPAAGAGPDDSAALRHALRVVGPRWALLIVGELLASGPSRFVDLVAALPGISPNTLTARLRALEHDGVLSHRRLPAPAACWVYELAPRGRRLAPAIEALRTWADRTDP